MSEGRFKYEIDVEQIRPLPDGREWAAKVVALRDGDNKPVPFDVKEYWGKTRAEAVTKAVAAVEAQLN